MVFAPLTLIFIFLISYLGQSFGVLFGGGGFVMQPALLAFDIAPKLVVANTIAAAASSMFTFLITSKQHPALAKSVVPLMVPTMLIGAFLGSFALRVIPEEFVRWIILGVCSLGFLYIVTHIRQTRRNALAPQKTASSEKREPVKHWKIILPIAALGMGFYDGFISAGGGTLIIMVLSLILRADMKSTIHISVWLGAISLTTASVMHGLKGYLEPSLLMVMIPACLIAGATGAKITEFVAEKTLRTIYCVTVTCLLAYLLYDNLIA